MEREGFLRFHGMIRHDSLHVGDIGAEKRIDQLPITFRFRQLMRVRLAQYSAPHYPHP
jgi:hypothetical protein